MRRHSKIFLFEDERIREVAIVHRVGDRPCRGAHGRGRLLGVMVGVGRPALGAVATGAAVGMGDILPRPQAASYKHTNIITHPMRYIILHIPSDRWQYSISAAVCHVGYHHGHSCTRARYRYSGEAHLVPRVDPQVRSSVLAFGKACVCKLEGVHPPLVACPWW
ncbi:hypothetical protein [Thermobaculum terrenum]|uniref:hypothetical protein n=1 Tax=Thermobaculum terrenum TaxID=166501 RepID=UPI0011D12A07|nr:hypothetical protein [Thermobaculum terrenum]